MALRPALFLLYALLTGCGSLLVTNGPPDKITGTFEDDYGIAYSIMPDRWVQHPNATYVITRWNVEEQYLIAQNGPGNPSDAGLWTRIDWSELEDMEPYEWAFCLSAYDAPSADAAEQTGLADREHPRTGCNGFPFSRMKRTVSDSPTGR